MKRLSYFSLFSLVLLIPACGWMNNGRRRCCYPVAAPVCCPAAPAPADASYAPAPSAYYDEQQPAAQASYTEGAYDETGAQLSAAPARPAPVAQDQFAGDEDFDLDEDDQELKTLDTKASAAQVPARTPAAPAPAADEDEDDTK